MIIEVGYESKFNRGFFKYQTPRSLHEIDVGRADVENRIWGYCGR